MDRTRQWKCTWNIQVLGSYNYNVIQTAIWNYKKLMKTINVAINAYLFESNMFRIQNIGV